VKTCDELVIDDENLLLEKCRTVLKQKCEDSFDKLRDLEEIKQKLEIDLQDKTEALRIDIDQLELTERSTGLSHKPDPLKVSFVYLFVFDFFGQKKSTLFFYYYEYQKKGHLLILLSRPARYS
jgi:hypothetical protein